MLRILAIGDPHFAESTKAETTILVRETLAYVDEHKPDLVWVAGDILDKHENCKSPAHADASRFLDQLRAKVRTIALIGNHDRINNDDFLSETHFFVGMKDKANLDIVDRPLVIELKGLKIVAVPYVPPGRFREALGTVLADDNGNPLLTAVDLVLAHQEIAGCRLTLDVQNPKSISKLGDVWTNLDPPLVSGHIHIRQNFGNIYYIGTPFQHSFAEDIHKGVALLTLTKPRNLKIDYLPLNIPAKMEKTLTVAEAYQYAPPENAKLKLWIYGSDADVDAFTKTPQCKFLQSRAKVVFERTSTHRDVTQQVLPERPNYWNFVYEQLNPAQNQLLRDFFAQ